MKDPYLQEWLLAPDGVATHLRLLRGAQTGRDFAEAAGMRPAKLSKLELGQQVPTEEDIRQLVAAGGGAQTDADRLVAKLRQMPAVRSEGERQLRFSQVAAQRRLNDRLRNAGHVRIFESLYLPRPFQQLHYSRFVIAQLGQAHGSTEGFDQAAAVIAGSAQHLHDPARQFDVIVSEAVLRWQMPDPAANRHQLEHLLQLMALPNLTLRVVPLDTQLPVQPSASFALYDQAGYLDSLTEGAQLTGTSLGGHVSLMQRLSDASVDGRQTRSIIEAALGRL
ncbi:hypothetical protein GCM10010172_07130 [Paractinoplanes ferrugineus]|uniref:DUF5753 domain-containing protein n=1 Tax=Paractinoplanes ferrugineus TaxID=113564 RepID=A0A919J9U8_9ACTN|nr:Scr1 family TA system antitoxin-like transcriptional regulator [Actinoplanes ferrugineus]GIE16808.1 hypothetical protein Afe05nite_86480 [Actinoplanes ferrugineus]